MASFPQIGCPALLALVASLGACQSGEHVSERVTSASQPLVTPTVVIDFGAPVTWATHAELSKWFGFGIPDGSLGVIDTGAKSAAGQEIFRYFGSGSSVTSGLEGVYSMTGPFGSGMSIQSWSSASSTTAYFGPNAAATAGATGWMFDTYYAGGGQLVPFSYEGVSGYFMPYHGEYHPPGSGPTGPFYGGLGLAVSTNAGASFHSIGQVIQMYPSLPEWQARLDGEADAGTRQAPIGGGYGSLVLADANGNYLPNPPPEADQADNAFFYLFYQDADFDPLAHGNPSNCQYFCLAVARAPYLAVMSSLVTPTVTPASASIVAGLFTKYTVASNGSAQWTQPGDSGRDDESEESGLFSALLPDQNASLASVLWDTVAGRYLMAFMASDTWTLDNEGICVRESSDLIHWSPGETAPSSPPDCLAFFQTPSSGTTHHTDIYPTLVGDTGSQLVGAGSPYVFFQNFVAFKDDAGSDAFPDYATSELDYIPLLVTVLPPPPRCKGTTCM
jgi:hypothetical protein